MAKPTSLDTSQFVPEPSLENRTTTETRLGSSISSKQHVQQNKTRESHKSKLVSDCIAGRDAAYLWNVLYKRHEDMHDYYIKFSGIPCGSESISLFQALSWWGRTTSGGRARKKWGGSRKGGPPSLPLVLTRLLFSLTDVLARYHQLRAYPASDDIIFIDICVISFLTTQLAVFSRAVKHMWFSVICCIVRIL